MEDFTFEDLFIGNGVDDKYVHETFDDQIPDITIDGCPLEYHELKKPCWDDFTILKLIGKGAYGQVYQASNNKDGRVYAIKVLKKDFLLKQDAIENTMTEKDILAKIRHPFIVKLYGAFQTEERVAFVMEYINGGQLFFHLRKEACFDEAVAKFYTAELILALEHLHSHNIIHRDLKPENILINSNGHVILTDFGLAKDSVTEDNASTFCGTVEYMAPEMVKGQKYGKATDFWSVGILLYDMLAGHPPFRHKNQKKLQEFILTKKISMPSYWNKNTHSLIRGLTERDPKKRLKIDQIKSHPFFAGLKWNELLNQSSKPPFVPQVPAGAFDISNFSPSYTNKKPSFSPAALLSNSQDEMFTGFSFVRSVSPMFGNKNL